MIPSGRPLRRTLRLWLRAALRRNTKYPILLDNVDELGEMRAMLSESIEQWAREFRAEGLAEGIEKGIEKGLAKGREEGREEGVLMGEARVLSRQLRRRFGDLPHWVEERLANASIDELALWAETILDADSLEEMFSPPASRH